MRTREGLAWTAGFYEGEGNIATVRGASRTQPHIQLQIGQADRDALDCVRAATGLGVVLGPYENTGRSFVQSATRAYKPKFLFHLSGIERSQAFIAMVWPWLSTWRREQAKTALAAMAAHWNTMTDEQKRRSAWVSGAIRKRHGSPT